MSAAQQVPEERGLPPLHGIRALEIMSTRACSIAGMLLADLGAELIAVQGPRGRSRAWPVEDPAAVAWGRGKLAATLSDEQALRLAGQADLVLSGATRRQLVATPWEWLSASCGDGPNTVWMPPYCATGEWEELVED